MKTCPRCNAHLSDKAVFCEVCGVRVDAEVQAPQTNVQINQGYHPYNSGNVAYCNPQGSHGNKKKLSKTAIIAIAVTGLLILGAIIIFGIYQHTKNQYVGAWTRYAYAWADDGITEETDPQVTLYLYSDMTYYIDFGNGNSREGKWNISLVPNSNPQYVDFVEGDEDNHIFDCTLILSEDKDELVEEYKARDDKELYGKFYYNRGFYGYDVDYYDND